MGASSTEVTKRATRLARFGTAANAAPATFTPVDPATNFVFSQIISADLGPFVQPRRKDKKFMPSIGVQHDLAEG